MFIYLFNNPFLGVYICINCRDWKMQNFLGEKHLVLNIMLSSSRMFLALSYSLRMTNLASNTVVVWLNL